MFTGLTAGAADRGVLGQQTYHPEWMSAWMHGWMNGLVHGLMHGWMHGWIEGRLTDGKKVIAEAVWKSRWESIGGSLAVLWRR